MKKWFYRLCKLTLMLTGVAGAVVGVSLAAYTHWNDVETVMQIMTGNGMPVMAGIMFVAVYSVYTIIGIVKRAIESVRDERREMAEDNHRLRQDVHDDVRHAVKTLTDTWDQAGAKLHSFNVIRQATQTQAQTGEEVIMTIPQNKETEVKQVTDAEKINAAFKAGAARPPFVAFMTEGQAHPFANELSKQAGDGAWPYIYACMEFIQEYSKETPDEDRLRLLAKVKNTSQVSIAHMIVMKMLDLANAYSNAASLAGLAIDPLDAKARSFDSTDFFKGYGGPEWKEPLDEIRKIMVGQAPRSLAEEMVKNVHIRCTGGDRRTDEQAEEAAVDTLNYCRYVYEWSGNLAVVTNASDISKRRLGVAGSITCHDTLTWHLKKLIDKFKEAKGDVDALPSEDQLVMKTAQKVARTPGTAMFFTLVQTEYDELCKTTLAPLMQKLKDLCQGGLSPACIGIRGKIVRELSEPKTHQEPTKLSRQSASILADHVMTFTVSLFTETDANRVGEAARNSLRTTPYYKDAILIVKDEIFSVLEVYNAARAKLKMEIDLQPFILRAARVSNKATSFLDLYDEFQPKPVVETCEDCNNPTDECDCCEEDEDVCEECGNDADDCECCSECGHSDCECEDDDDDSDEETLDSVDNDAYELGVCIAQLKDLLHDCDTHDVLTRQQNELMPAVCKRLGIPDSHPDTKTDWTHFRRMHAGDQLLLEVIILQYTRKLSAKYHWYTDAGLAALVASRDPAVYKVVRTALMERLDGMLYNVEVKLHCFSNGEQFAQDKCLYRYWKEVVAAWKKEDRKA